MTSLQRKPSATTSTAALEAIGVRKTYPDGTIAVRGIDLDVPRGHCVALVGQSGSGKSTLARCLLGIEPMDAGQVRINGQSLPSATLRNRHQARFGMQAVFQSSAGTFNSRLPLITSVLEPLDAQPNLLRERLKSAGSRRRLAAELFERVQLSDQLLDRLPGSVSGGQLQRAAIARAVSTDPAVIVLDEPTASLDVPIQARILNLLKDLRSALGLTMVFITHDLAAARFIANDIIVMRDGQILDRCAPQELCSPERHPYTKQLVHLFE